MVVRQSPGVFVTEIDKSVSLEQIGTGGIGIAVKLNKGMVGKPFVVSSENNLIETCGKPIPGFNLMSWHSVSNMIQYAGSVVVSRVENTEYSAKHNNSLQKFEIPVNSAQFGAHLTGNTTPFNFDTELQYMIKNRVLFKTTNERNQFDVYNSDLGVEIEDLDNAVLIDNDDTLTEYVDNASFNTKAKFLYKLPKLGLKSVAMDDDIPNLEVGQVYNHNGKIIEVGNNIYDNHIMLEVVDGNTYKTGTGTFHKELGSATEVIGTGTSFLSELKSGSSVKAYWFATATSHAGTITRNGSNYKRITNSVAVSGIEAGDRIIVAGVFRTVASVSSPDIYLTSDAPSTWSGVAWTYSARETETLTVNQITSDSTFTTTGNITSIPESSESTFEYRLVDSTTLTGGIQTVVEKIYRDETDTTNKTIIGVNTNFHTLLKVGSKIVVDFGGGTIEERYIVSIPDTGTDKAIINEAWTTLTTEEEDAKVFKYANYYLNANDANVDKYIYTENAVGLIVSSDELNNTDNRLRYIVKVISGSFAKNDIVCLSQLGEDEWSYFSAYVTTSTEISKENNLFLMKLSDNALALERGDVVYFSDDTAMAGDEYNADADVLMASDIESVDLVLIEITGGDSPIISVDDMVAKTLATSSETWADLTTSTVEFIRNYEDVLVYETIEDETTEMIMVNETVNGMTTAVKNRYTYVYDYTRTPATDKQIFVSTDTVTNLSIASTEFARVFAVTPGAWADAENISVAMCDMNHYEAGATVEANGITFSSLFEFAPDTTDKSLFCVVVIKDDLVIEKYIVSSDPKSKDEQNSSQYAHDVINSKSGTIRLLLNTSIFSPNEINGYELFFNTIYSTPVSGGYSGKLFELDKSAYYATESTVTMDVTEGYVKNSNITTAYDLFRNKDNIDIGYLVDGEWAGNAVIANWMKGICYERGDAIAIISPSVTDIVGIRDTATIKQNILNYVNNNSLLGGDRSFQYIGIFANCKQIYDVYNETYVWLPISVDSAGLNNYVDNYFEPWYAVAGMTRGVIRNIVKLGWNPTQSERDALYSNRINPVVYFKGEGTYIYGVRTLCSVKSDLADMYNRKTLNYISKNLAKYLRQVLFEFNDGITRGQVVNNIEPFLRNIKAKRGLIDYQVKCNSDNNPNSVVEQNQLVCDVYLKMAHVIETVSLNFIVTKASVSFSEA